MHLVELTTGNDACYINVEQIAYVMAHDDSNKTIIGFVGDNYLTINGNHRGVVDIIKSERIRYLLELAPYSLTAK